MQTHKDIWFSVSDEHEHIYFRAYHKPTPVLDFIPWPIRVKGIVFSDGSELHSAHGSPAFFAGPGISITQTPGDPDIYTISNTQLQTPWQSNIDAASFLLNNANVISGFRGTSVQGASNIVLGDGNINLQAYANLGINNYGNPGAAPGNGNFNIGCNNGQLTISAYPASISLFSTPWQFQGPSGDRAGVVITAFSSALTVYQTGTGINLGSNVLPEFPLDVNGIINTSSCYYVSEAPFACSNGEGGVDLSNISTINGATPGSQTPWLSDIDGNRFELTNVEYINANTDISANDFSINGIEFALAGAGPSEVALINISTINGAPVGLIGSYNPQPHDLTGIRVPNNQYGPFPQARFVSVFLQLIGASDNAFLNLILAGQVTAIPVAGTGTGAEPQTGFLFGLVPAGAIYVVDTAMVVTTWLEYY